MGLQSGILTGKGAVMNPVEEKKPDCLLRFDVHLDPSVDQESTQKVKERFDQQLNLFLKMAEVDGSIIVED